MELFVSIGLRLREERERLRQSQSELADVAAAAGVRGSTRQSQSIYEKGERAPDAGYLAAVAGAGVDVRYVLTGSRDYEVPEGLKPEEQLLLDYYRAASREVRNAAMGALMGAQPGAPRQVFHGKVGTAVAGNLKTLNLNKRPKG